MNCRACDKKVHEVAWAGHVKAHKIRYCLDIGLDKDRWYDVDWENVVRLYNPKRSRIPNPELEKNRIQKSLEAFT